MTSYNFEDLYAKYQPKIYRLCLGYFGGNKPLASDTCQDIFIKVWQNINHFQGQSKISTWIYRIAVNTCLNVLRSSQYKRKYQQLHNNISDDKETNEKESQIHAMYKCITQLKPKDRSIILLVLDQEPYENIANIMGLSENNIRVKIHRIKDKLSKCVQP